VAGFRIQSASTSMVDWRGWDFFTEMFHAVQSLPGATSTDRGQQSGLGFAGQRFPQWPLDNHNSFRLANAVVFSSTSAGFFTDSTGGLFLVLDTDPLTVWSVDPAAPPQTSPLLFVGGVCQRGNRRIRVMANTRVGMFALGDAGCWLIPPCAEVDATACCVVEEVE